MPRFQSKKKAAGGDIPKGKGKTVVVSLRLPLKLKQDLDLIAKYSPDYNITNFIIDRVTPAAAREVEKLKEVWGLK